MSKGFFNRFCQKYFQSIKAGNLVEPMENVYMYVCMYIYIMLYYDLRENYGDGQTEKTSRNSEYNYSQRI